MDKHTDVCAGWCTPRDRIDSYHGVINTLPVPSRNRDASRASNTRHMRL